MARTKAPAPKVPATQEQQPGEPGAGNQEARAIKVGDAVRDTVRDVVGTVTAIKGDIATVAADHPHFPSEILLAQLVLV